MSIFSDFGITEKAFSALILLYSALLLILLFVAGLLFYLKGYGIYKMSRKLGIKRSWRGFVPFLTVNAFGDLASAKDKKDVMKKFVTVSFYLTFLLVLAAYISSVFSLTNLLFEADKAVAAGKELDPNIFTNYNISVIFVGLAFVSYLVYKISILISSYKIFNTFCSKNAALFSVISFVLPFLLPFFMYSACKNEPESFAQEENESEFEMGFRIYNEQ
ncbi:MAG: hypothetical protein IKK24_00355 [Clostridia bacterium]|nr:hypothetical protein [Clostridia bacterium]